MAQPVKQIINPWNCFSKELTKLISIITTDVAPIFGVTEITPELFVYSALENNDCMLYKAVNSYLNSGDISKIHDEIGSNFIKNDGIINGKIDFSRKMLQLFNIAYSEKDKTQSDFITSDHILLSILSSKNTDELLKTIFSNVGLSYDIMVGLSKKVHDVIDNDIKNIDDNINGFFENNGVKIISARSPQELFSKIINSEINKIGVKNKPSKVIDFCTNINSLAIDGKLDDLVGRTKEVNNMFRVLSRRTSNNVLLVGEPGVGKTQCVYGIAKMIVDGTSPYQFKDKEIFKFNSAEIMAGTQFRGMLEDRIVTLTKQFKSKKNAILFIDDLDVLFGDRHGSSHEYDSGGALTNVLTDGDIQVIATVSYKGLKTITNENPDIVKKFQIVNIDKPSNDECIEIIMNAKKYYEDFHNVHYSDEIIRKTVGLCSEYITDKQLPSSAIDIIDELGAYKKLEITESNEVKRINSEISCLEKEKDVLIKTDSISNANDIDDKLNELRNSLARELSKIRKTNKAEISQEDLYKVISDHTNIPISEISISEKEKLKAIGDIIKNKIVGQDEAIDIVVKAIKRNKIGINPHNKPILSIFANGPTGCGKTLLAKTLAKEIFGDEKYLVRFDMSEYSDETSVNKLIGSSAGYVGYNEGGLLTEAVKNKKYCVLLIDEIEKANDKIFNLLLQVLDEGFLTDNTGQKVDFRNTIIILTSNVGAKRASVDKYIGFGADEGVNRVEIIKKEMKSKFPPEFLNRLDDIVFFNNLTEDNLKSIIRLELGYLSARIENIGQSINYDETIVEHLFKCVENEKEYGARPIHRAIRDKIENKLADLIIDNDYLNHTFIISCENNDIVVK